MPEDCNGKHLKLWTPATYRIEVVGALDESWSDRLGGMLIKTRQRADQSTVTTLTGRLKDQAELKFKVTSRPLTARRFRFFTFFIVALYNKLMSR